MPLAKIIFKSKINDVDINITQIHYSITKISKIAKNVLQCDRIISVRVRRRFNEIKTQNVFKSWIKQVDGALRRINQIVWKSKSIIL